MELRLVGLAESVYLVVLVVTPLPGTEIVEVVDKLYRCDPRDHFESKLVRRISRELDREPPSELDANLLLRVVHAYPRRFSPGSRAPQWTNKA